MDIVHDALVPRRPLDARPALEHQALHVEARQHGQRAGKAGHGSVLDGIAAAREAGLAPVKINTVVQRGTPWVERPAIA